MSFIQDEMGHFGHFHDLRGGCWNAMDAVFDYHQHCRQILPRRFLHRRMDHYAPYVGLRTMYFTRLMDVGESGKIPFYYYFLKLYSRLTKYVFKRDN